MLGRSPLSITFFPADLPPGYSYPATGMGFSEAHSAEPADPDTMHAGSPPAEPEQSRTFSPASEVLREPGPPREPPASGAMAEGPGVLLHCHHLLLNPGPLCGERGPAPAAGATEEPFGVCREAAQGAPEQSPPEQQHAVPVVGGSPLPPAVEEEDEDEDGDEEEGNSDGSELEGSCDEDGEGSSGQQGCLGGLEALIAAGIDLGELPALSSPGEPPPAPPSPAPHASGIPGIALLSELADLELRRRRCDLALDGEQPPVPPSTPCFMVSWLPSPPWHLLPASLHLGAPVLPWCQGAACPVGAQQRGHAVDNGAAGAFSARGCGYTFGAGLWVCQCCGRSAQCSAQSCLRGSASALAPGRRRDSLPPSSASPGNPGGPGREGRPGCAGASPALQRARGRGAQHARCCLCMARSRDTTRQWGGRGAPP